jgi:glycogen operon protein
LSTVKLIAEPWDLGEGGYQVGNFPGLWSEWNGKYRDAIRDFWRGQGGTVAEFAARFSGSSDLYKTNGRRPYASINYVTAHDGFTLQDLVSYNDKHNESNCEDNQDGERDNRSWNCGVEGPTGDNKILKLRDRQRRNLIATLALSQGVPMLLGGDELGRTQDGNNNAYCQDNEVSWFNWKTVDASFHAFVKDIMALRGRHPTFRRREWLQTDVVRTGRDKDIVWFTAEGNEMATAQREREPARSFAAYLSGDDIASSDPRGLRRRDESFLILFNAGDAEVPFTLPDQSWGRSWTVVVDTHEPEMDASVVYRAGDSALVQAKTMVLMQERTEPSRSGTS